MKNDWTGCAFAVLLGVVCFIVTAQSLFGSAMDEFIASFF